MRSRRWAATGSCWPRRPPRRTCDGPTPCSPPTASASPCPSPSSPSDPRGRRHGRGQRERTDHDRRRRRGARVTRPSGRRRRRAGRGRRRRWSSREPGDDAGWAEPPAATSGAAFAGIAPGLGEAFARGRADGVEHFGYAEHGVETVYLGSSTGLRRRHVQATGRFEMTAKSHGRSRSAWVGRSGVDLAGGRRRRLRRRAAARPRLAGAADRRRRGPAGRRADAGRDGRPDGVPGVVGVRPATPRTAAPCSAVRAEAPGSASG